MQEGLCKMAIDESLISFNPMIVNGEPYLRVVYRDELKNIVGISTPKHYFNNREGGVLIKGALMIFPFVENIKDRDEL